MKQVRIWSRPWLILVLVALAACRALERDGAPGPAGAPAKTIQFFPDFPWPPPAASTTLDITRPLNAGLGWWWRPPHKPETLGDIDAALKRALWIAGYHSMSYFAIPRGFALVTPIEQFDADGAAKTGAERWAVSRSAITVDGFSLRAYLRALLTADPGHYRVLVFTATDVPVNEAERWVTEAEAMDWLHRGGKSLPLVIAQQPWISGSACIVLVYEFVRSGQESPQFVNSSGLDALSHLRPQLATALGMGDLP